MKNGRHEIVMDALHLLVLTSMALVQPLLDLLGRYSDFFVAHGAGLSVIVTLVLVVMFIPPLALISLEGLVRLLGGEKWRRVLHLCFVGFLAGLILLPPLNRWGVLPEVAIYLVALVFGSLFGWGYIRWKWMRSFVTALSLAVLLFPAYFLFFTPVHGIAFPKRGVHDYHVTIGNKVPVTLLVFDEFTSLSLLNQDGQIDSVRFPNFAALARDGWWFPNATSSSLETTKSIPAILTGKLQSVTEYKPATYSEHPDNLFSLLRGKYYMNIEETETSLYPDTLKKLTKVFELEDFKVDILLMYRVLFVPGELQRSAHFFGAKWKGFGRVSRVQTTVTVSRDIIYRKNQIEAFVEGIVGGKMNQLNFLHLSLPHVPYEFLSTGKFYSTNSTFPDGIECDEKGWGPSQELAEVTYQRYLQQVGFTDKMLGKVIAKLKREGLYQQSLIVITADHGVAMLPNLSRRSYTPENGSSLIKIPLILKLPHATSKGISPDLVAGVDLFPTIADVLQVEIPWKTDGMPMKPESQKLATKRSSVTLPGLGNFTASDLEDSKLLAWKVAVFGSSTPLTTLVRMDAYQSLLNKRVEEFEVRKVKNPAFVSLENIDQLDHVQLEGDFLPALIRGRFMDEPSQAGQPLALVLNDTLRATMTTVSWDHTKSFFTALIAEEAFREGKNEIGIYRVQGSPLKPVLVRLPILNHEQFRVKRVSEKESYLVFEDGVEILAEPANSTGFIDSYYQGEKSVSFTGWAFDKEKEMPVRMVLIFSGKRYLGQAIPSVKRNDLVSFMKSEKARMSGFQVEIPKERMSRGKISGYALTKDGRVFELIVTEEVKRRFSGE